MQDEDLICELAGVKNIEDVIERAKRLRNKIKNIDKVPVQVVEDLKTKLRILNSAHPIHFETKFNISIEINGTYKWDARSGVKPGKHPEIKITGEIPEDIKNGLIHEIHHNLLHNILYTVPDYKNLMDLNCAFSDSYCRAIAKFGAEAIRDALENVGVEHPYREG